MIREMSPHATDVRSTLLYEPQKSAPPPPPPPVGAQFTTTPAAGPVPNPLVPAT